MNLSPAQIEQIVGEVVRRLRELTAKPELAPVATHVGERELVLADAVVTLRSLEGRLANVRRLVVRPKAVVTPAVRDELKKAGVTLERREIKATTVGAIRLLVAATDEKSGRELKTGLIVGGERIESQATQSLGGTVRELARHIAGRKLPALLLTAEPFAAVVEANRLDGLRAALVVDAGEVNRAAVEATANLFVVAAGKVSSNGLARVAAAIGALGR